MIIKHEGRTVAVIDKVEHKTVQELAAIIKLQKMQGRTYKYTGGIDNN